MANIRARKGAKGTTYQVRFADPASSGGFAYKTFSTRKEAKAFQESGGITKAVRSRNSLSVEEAIQRWLDACQREGRDGKDPVSPATFKVYESRATIMRAYVWDKDIAALASPDIVAFRSWLLKTYTRDQAQKVMSSFHSVLLEMVAQGSLATDPASRITVRQSRYDEPVAIPSVDEVQCILRTADDLAEDSNFYIARAWRRYRPMVRLAVETGMRPQEYLVARTGDLLPGGIRISQAVDRSNQVGPPKSRAGRRFIPLGQDTLTMLRELADSYVGLNPSGLLFPGETGQHQVYDNFRKRCWLTLMEKAGLMDPVIDDRGTALRAKDGKPVMTARYAPYSLRHFFASVLIANNTDLKTIQSYMGHEDAAMTLNVYGHLIRSKRAEEEAAPIGIVSQFLSRNGGNFVPMAE